MSRSVNKSENIVLKICDILSLDEKVIEQIFKRYSESHRYYHNIDHIADIINQINDFYQFVAVRSPHNEWENMMYYAAIFHDIVYDPKSKTNEEDSIGLMYELLKDEESKEFLDKIAEIIKATKYSSNNLTEKQKIFCQFDLNGFEKSFSHVLKNEKKIRKEYQWVDWDVYKNGRENALKPFLNSVLLSDKAKDNIKFELEYIKFCQPNIAVYPGSFAPFHIGHLNILHKAEKIFDKVIIAVGQNPEKPEIHHSHPSLCDDLKYHQVDFYSGLLTDYLKSKPYPLTVIRGLRNSIDLQAELNQYRWLQELMPEINVISIFCDKEYEHISSSAIRAIKQYGQEYYDKYIV